MVGALSREMELRAGFLPGGSKTAINTIYFGGGTPSLLPVADIAHIINRAGELFDISGVEEITLEANPDDLSPEYLCELRRAGVNRLSIGVQSFIDTHLRWMNRRHDAARAVTAVREAQEAGFDNISVDIIYGLPVMSMDELSYNLDTLLYLGIQHISAYHLTIEPGSVFGRRAGKGLLSPIGEQESRAHYDLVHDRLTEAGFTHYEISNFALPEHESRHNSSYWNGTPYLGLGPSAHSFDGKSRGWNVSDNAAYLRGVESGNCYTVEHLDAKDRYNEYVMTSLRTAGGADTRVIAEHFGQDMAGYFTAGAEKFVARGVMEKDGPVYRIPAHLFIISDGIISDLFAV